MATVRLHPPEGKDPRPMMVTYDEAGNGVMTSYLNVDGRDQDVFADLARVLADFGDEFAEAIELVISRAPSSGERREGESAQSRHLRLLA